MKTSYKDLVAKFLGIEKHISEVQWKRIYNEILDADFYVFLPEDVKVKETI